MFISHLSLANFRNYPRLELDLPPHIVVLQGENAQGKSNLLEAIYLLAAGRSPRAMTDRELINRSALSDELPVCRVAAKAQRGGSNLSLELAMMPRATSSRGADLSYLDRQTEIKAPPMQKRIRVNGVVRRAIDLVGQINAVTFSILDIDVIGGQPALRRRYLDITNSQVDAHYLRQLQRYQRVLWQRNRLLRQIAEQEATLDELSFWDHELVESGAYLMLRRDQTVAELSKLAEATHDELSGGQGKLRIVYCRSIDKDTGDGSCHTDEIAEAFTQALQSVRHKELAQGISLAGPHRDDLRFLTDEVDIGVYGSRGQQRTVALAIKLAEAKFMLGKTGEYPILLLDDVLSELDSRRRSHLLQSVAEYQQVLMTTTDLDDFEPGFLAQADVFTVSAGCVERLAS